MRTDDGHIVYKCLNGEPEAFGFLVDKYKESVYAFAYSKLGDFHDAEDAAQEAFIKAYQKLHTLRRWDSFHVWIYSITSNICKNLLRLRSSRPDGKFIEDEGTQIIQTQSMKYYREDSICESVRESLRSLPEIHRQVLTLFYLGGMNTKEIAEFLGISPNTVIQRLYRARLQLREEMLIMFDTAFEGRKLPVGFTLRIVEIIKHIRINPISPIKSLPWGLSLAAGIIAAIIGLNTNLSFFNQSEFMTGILGQGESKVLNVGEFPVDVAKVSDISVMSNQHFIGDGLGSVVPSLHNALFMASQAEETWTKKADMPAPRSHLSVCGVNGKIYAIGGLTQLGIALPTVEEYDPMTDKWTRKADMLTARLNLSSCVANGKIYAIGGWPGQGASIELSTVEEYDPVTDKWTKKTNMPTERQMFSSSSADGKIYAIGGWRKGIELTTVEEYDPTTDKWTKKNDILIATYGLSACTVKEKIYVIGGYGVPDDPFQIVEEYDPATDIWVKKADMPTARAYLSSSVVNEKIYAFGGMNNIRYLSAVEEYDPATDTWAKKSDMPTARAYLSTGTVKDKIYAIGGDVNTIGNALSIIEEYDPGTAGQNINLKGKLPTTWGDMKLAQYK